MGERVVRSIPALSILKWFHEDGEEAVEPAGALLDALAARRIDLVILDLAIYEIGTVLVRSLGVDPAATATVLDAITEIRDPSAMTGAERAVAARLATDHGLTFYDAAYAAVAEVRHGRLVTMDRALIDAGLGMRPEQLDA